MAWRRLLVGTAAVLVLALGGAVPAGAHPLGNFTVNRYARIELSAGFLRVHYVLDQAEIPAFQARRALAAGRAAFADSLVAEIGGGLRLAIDGRPVPLRPAGRLLSEPPGQGGLPTLRLAVTYAARLPPGDPTRQHRAIFADTNQPERVGWREVLVVARGGDARVVSTDVPGRDVSDELRRYPTDLLSAPLDRRTATFSFVPGSESAPASPLTGSAAAPDRPGTGFAALITRDSGDLLALAGLLAVALGFGALHALGPGHGKTLMAAYLVSTRGRPRDAVALGGVVSVMHTASVLALALVLVQLDRSVGAESIYPWLELASGAVVVGMGAWLLVSRLRRRPVPVAPYHDHDHDHDHHGHSHDHGPHGHSHELAPGVSPLSRRGVLALGAAGGLFPSPTAVVVVVSAFSLHRPGLGLGLVGAFSVGLASTLTVVGLALVKGRSILERRGGRRALQVLPLAGATALVAAGLVIAARGVAALG
ncbi:MAG: nickel/cobalt transporter [Acidimicrobiales bacterium]